MQKLIAGLPLPNLPGLADNYFATGDYTFDRHNVDAKVNYNPTTKLGIVGRVGWLGYEFRNPPMFGDLGGLPVNRRRPRPAPASATPTPSRAAFRTSSRRRS